MTEKYLCKYLWKGVLLCCLAMAKTTLRQETIFGANKFVKTRSDLQLFCNSNLYCGKPYFGKEFVDSVGASLLPKLGRHHSCFSGLSNQAPFVAPPSSGGISDVLPSSQGSE